MWPGGKRATFLRFLDVGYKKSKFFGLSHIFAKNRRKRHPQCGSKIFEPHFHCFFQEGLSGSGFFKIFSQSWATFSLFLPRGALSQRLFRNFPQSWATFSLFLPKNLSHIFDHFAGGGSQAADFSKFSQVEPHFSKNLPKIRPQMWLKKISQVEPHFSKKSLWGGQMWLNAARSPPLKLPGSFYFVARRRHKCTNLPQKLTKF